LLRCRRRPARWRRPRRGGGMVESDEGKRLCSAAVERKDGSRPRAVERVMVEHAVTVRWQLRGRGVGAAAEWVRAFQVIQRKGKLRAEYYFFSNTVRVCWAVRLVSRSTNGVGRQIPIRPDALTQAFPYLNCKSPPLFYNLCSQRKTLGYDSLLLNTPWHPWLIY
jgi:hypothetical protein